jgi:hypothetical protein
VIPGFNMNGCRYGSFLRWDGLCRREGGQLEAKAGNGDVLAGSVLVGGLVDAEFVRLTFRRGT